jgi:hypothetical protein
MPQKSFKVGEFRVTYELNLAQCRRRAATERRTGGRFSTVDRQRTGTELNDLRNWLAANKTTTVDQKVSLDLLNELALLYDSLSGYSPSDYARIVNLELLILKKLFLELPLELRNVFLNRIEDLYVEWSGIGFTNPKGTANEKLDAIGQLITRKRGL